MPFARFLKQGILREFPSMIPLTMRAVDVVIVAGLFALTHAVHMGELTFRIALVLLPLVLWSVFGSYRIYQPWRGTPLRKELWTVVLAWFSVLALLLLIFSFLHWGAPFFDGVSAASLLGTVRLRWVVASLLGLVGYRVLLQEFLITMRRRGKNCRFVVIVGAGDLGRRAQGILDENTWTGFRVVAFFDDDPQLQGTTVGGVPVIGGIDRMQPYLHGHIVDQILIALPLRAEERVRAVLAETAAFPVVVSLVPDIYRIPLHNYSLTEVAGLPIINFSADPFQSKALIMKWVEDKLLSFGALIVLSPLLLLIAIGIKWSSPGPVIFRQQRYGKGGKVFTLYKFRTMRSDQPATAEGRQATRDDPRVTPFGRVLRGTSCDELPQFFNVLKGDMSIVGPRPHMVEHNEMYKDQVEAYVWRHKVKPGLTGLAQVRGFRGETQALWKMAKRVELDLQYIHHWSLWLDVKIVCATVVRGFVHTNAY